MAKDVIIACDFPDKERTLSFLDNFKGKKPYVKIGMELFYSEGADMLKRIKDRGHEIFLDLKLYDIPNTVKSAMKVLSGLQADMVNLHTAGGSEMMKAALEGLSGEGKKRPLLIGVTILTSADENTLHNEMLISESMENTVMSYAKNAMKSGLDGVVCSALEAEKVKQACSRDFLTVTPGIRFADGETGDQKRVVTPERAAKIGSDYIVVGRPITKSEDPAAAYERCLQEFLS